MGVSKKKPIRVLIVEDSEFDARILVNTLRQGGYDPTFQRVETAESRRVREAKVYSEIVAHNISAAEVREKNPAAIILSGGPSSVYESGSPALDRDILELG
ncbi:MAG: glutamine-hydrolyzing synthase, partial [Verrucomicrobiota bacterium]